MKICTEYVKLNFNSISVPEIILDFDMARYRENLEFSIFFFFFQNNRSQTILMLEEKQRQFWNLH